jgi:hypothetical protein
MKGEKINGSESDRIGPKKLSSVAPGKCICRAFAVYPMVLFYLGGIALSTVFELHGAFHGSVFPHHVSSRYDPPLSVRPASASEPFPAISILKSFVGIGSGWRVPLPISARRSEFSGVALSRDDIFFYLIPDRESPELEQPLINSLNQFPSNPDNTGTQIVNAPSSILDNLATFTKISAVDTLVFDVSPQVDKLYPFFHNHNIYGLITLRPSALFNNERVSVIIGDIFDPAGVLIECQLLLVFFTFSMLLSYLASHSLNRNLLEIRGSGGLSSLSMLMHGFTDISSSVFIASFSEVSSDFHNQFRLLAIFQFLMGIFLSSRVNFPVAYSQFKFRFLTFLLELSVVCIANYIPHSNYLELRLCSLLIRYSQFIPQIVSTLIWPIPKSSDHLFCCLIALSRLLPLCFFYRNPSTVWAIGSPILVLSISMYVIVQVAIIFILDHFLLTLDRLFPYSYSTSCMCSANPDTNDICSICCELFDNGDTIMTTACSHAFHRKCLLEWTEGNLNCPICCCYVPDPH